LRRVACALALVCTVLECGRDVARTPPAPVRAEIVPPAPAPDESLRDVAPGIRVVTLERAYEGRFTRVVIVRLDLSRVTLGIETLPNLRFESVFARTDIDFAINGGFFEPGYVPSGLNIAGGVVLSPLMRRGGSGVLVVHDDVARLVSFDEAKALSGVDFAIQCGPRLIETDGSLGIASETPPRARRTALCIRDGGKTLDLVVATRRDAYTGPSLRTFAEWLKEGMPPGDTGCEAALNLDGGPSTGVFVRGQPSADVHAYGLVVQALVGRVR
jgi:uncharacterized protein YigE (DUF2233 family)